MSEFDAQHIAALDHFQFARSHPGYYFRSGVPTLCGLMERLVSDALILGCRHVEAMFDDEWAVVAASSDWIVMPSRVPVSEDSVFCRFFGFPESGINEVRGEGVVAAFCRTVVTSSTSGVRVVQGDVPASDRILSFLRRPGWQRAVAFKDLIGE